MNDRFKELLIAFVTIIWKRGDAIIDENELEAHMIEISYDDFINFDLRSLEVFHDEEHKVTRFIVR